MPPGELELEPLLPPPAGGVLADDPLELPLDPLEELDELDELGELDELDELSLWVGLLALGQPPRMSRDNSRGAIAISRCQLAVVSECILLNYSFGGYSLTAFKPGTKALGLEGAQQPDGHFVRIFR